MKRMFTGLQRRVASPLQSQDNASPSPSGDESPESIVVREIKAFCESSAAPGVTSNEYVHLPAIVEAAESSAGAAKEAALRIRKYLSSPSKNGGTVQYNSIMLIRILSENPGHSFTRNIDAKFVSVIKELLREGRDMNAQQMLRETLDMFESQKSWDEDLAALLAMWKKEKERSHKLLRSFPPQVANPTFQQPHYPQPVHTRRQLPPPDELAARVSEARTSANLLIQLAQSTPAAEVQSHDLMREFSQRCQGASRSIQSYMAVENPPPDENTMLTLIETNEQLSVALSKYQRTLLNARKALGSSTPVTTPPANGNTPANGILNGETRHTTVSTTGSRSQSASPPIEVSGSAAPSLPPLHSALDEPLSSSALPPALSPTPATTTTTPPTAPASSQQSAPRRYEYNADEFNVENPFADSAAEEQHSHSRLV